MNSSLRSEILKKEGTTFPSNAYKRLVLEPSYDVAKFNFIQPMIQVDFAHLIMLVEQGIMKKDDAVKIVNAIKKINTDEVKKRSYNPSYEDLFFEIEHFLIEEAGEAAGNLHIARSRNDMDIAIYRMKLREELLQLIQAGLYLRKSLVELTSEHIDTVMIGYTHTQQAQPTTLGHYFNAMTDLLTRDIKRFISAFKTVNCSSMGAAALTTTGFPINRKRVQELLAFDDMIDNSWDAVAGADYIGETATSVQLAAVDLGRSSQDLLLWATQEYGVIKLSAPYIQTSSIMPQKRNPVTLEHTRSLLSSVVGNAQTVLTMMHNTPFGDIVDTEDDMQPYMWRAMEDLQSIYYLLSSALMTMDVDREKLLNRAKESFANVTELADTIVRTNGIPFRRAHGIVSATVKDLVAQGKDSLEYFNMDILNSNAEKIIGRKLNLTEQQLREALSPEHFIKIRNIKGGPSHETMVKAIKVRVEEQDRMERWLNDKKEGIKSSNKKIENVINSWTC